MILGLSQSPQWRCWLCAPSFSSLLALTLCITANVQQGQGGRIDIVAEDFLPDPDMRRAALYRVAMAGDLSWRLRSHCP